MDNTELNKLAEEVDSIVGGNYKTHEVTARNHAKIQSLLVKTNIELIKTIRDLDSKNSKLQNQVKWLSVIAVLASVIALFK